MPKRAIIVHQWEGRHDTDWYPWLKSELEKKGYEVKAPEIPDPEAPKIEEWLAVLRNEAANPDEETYFIGHSVGCQAILRYLESLPEGTKVGGVIMVAGWFDSLTPEATPDEDLKAIAKPWLETPISWEKVRGRSKNFIAIFSDNDPYVPIDNSKVLVENLGAVVIVEKGKGHFTGEEDGVTELPVVLDELLKIAK